MTGAYGQVLVDNYCVAYIDVHSGVVAVAGMWPSFGRSHWKPLLSMVILYREKLSSVYNSVYAGFKPCLIV